MSKNKTPIWKKLAVIASMMTFIAGSLTGIMTYINLGLVDGFALAWAKSFAFSALVMAPVGMTMMALLDKLAKRLLPNLSTVATNITIGFIMAFIMESVMATMTTITNVGLADTSVYLSAWGAAFIAALPIGLTVGLFMSIFIKPHIQRIMQS